MTSDGWSRSGNNGRSGPQMDHSSVAPIGIADAVWKSDVLRARLTSAEAEPWVIEELKI